MRRLLPVRLSHPAGAVPEAVQRWWAETAVGFSTADAPAEGRRTLWDGRVPEPQPPVAGAAPRRAAHEAARECRAAAEAHGRWSRPPRAPHARPTVSPGRAPA